MPGVPTKMLHFAAMRDRFERQMADYLADVGRRLREARERNRPDLSSHAKAARELENLGVTVSEKQYGRWERGESEPRGDKRKVIATMVGVEVADLWGNPPIAPEQELRDQLDRIETMLDRLLDHFGIAATPAEEAALAAEQADQATRQKRGASSGKQGAKKKSQANG